MAWHDTSESVAVFVTDDNEAFMTVYNADFGGWYVDCPRAGLNHRWLLPNYCGIDAAKRFAGTHCREVLEDSLAIAQAIEEIYGEVKIEVGR